MRLHRCVPVLLIFSVCCVWSGLLEAGHWPAFRGAAGDGVSADKGIPSTWSEGDYKWNIELPGVGHAAPIIWGDRLFVTSAIEEGATRTLYCLEAATGRQLWAQPLSMNVSHKHAKSSWASSTPATDGRLVYSAFADQEKYLVSAWDFDGTLVWRRNMGEFESQHGLGVSMMLSENRLIVANDQDGPSSITALDKATGETLWSTARDIERVSYATPIMAPGSDGRLQLICTSGAMGITSLDPATGRLNWRSQGFPQRTVATTVLGDGLLIASCGQGGKGVNQIAVSVTGELDDSGLARVVWERKKVIPYVPTPIVYQSHLYEWGDDGVVGCVNLKTGADVWSRRVGGNFSGSPVCIDGRLYCISEKGEVVVIAAAPEFQELGRVNLNDGSHSTPAVANGRLYLRTFSRLMCLEARPAAAR